MPVPAFTLDTSMDAIMDSVEGPIRGDTAPGGTTIYGTDLEDIARRIGTPEDSAEGVVFCRGLPRPRISQCMRRVPHQRMPP